MIKKFTLPLVLLLCIYFNTSGLTTWIEGSANGFSGRSIRLSAYSDQLTYRLDLLGTALIADNGFFSMPVEVEDTIQVFLSIGFRKASLILVPGQRYYCLIEVDPDSLKQQLLPATNQLLPLILDKLAATDINRQLNSFNLVYGNFLSKNSKALLSARNKILLDSLKKVLNKSFTPKQGSFFDNYIFYSLASVEGMVNRMNDPAQYKKYLKDRPVRYNHPVYMDYFNNFFDHYLIRKSKYIKIRDLETMINKPLKLSALMDSLGKDSLLRNERIRELVLLKTMGEVYYEPNIDPSHVLALISQVHKQSKFPVHRTIAANLQLQLARLTRGTEAPTFTLTDQSGRERTLDEFRGKWAYLGFFTTWCDNCLAELQVIPSLKAKFGEKIEFISLCCDEDPLSLGYFIRANKQYDWTFFNIEDSMEILEAYQVLSFPLYVLIDPEGKIFQYPGRALDNHAAAIIESVIK